MRYEAQKRSRIKHTFMGMTAYESIWWWDMMFMDTIQLKLNNMIPTAEELLRQKPFINGMTRLDQQVAMIEFAKLHVERCKCEIEWVTSDIQDIYPLREEDLDFEKIYPLTNIK